MAIKLEMRELVLSAVHDPSRRTPQGLEPAEPVVSNRRRAVTGVIISLAVLTGAIIWQYFDNQAAFPASSQTGTELPVIGSAVLEADTTSP